MPPRGSSSGGQAPQTDDGIEDVADERDSGELGRDAFVPASPLSIELNGFQIAFSKPTFTAFVHREPSSEEFRT